MRSEDELREAGRHLVETVMGTVIQTDYQVTKIGKTVFVARCSCGWSAVRSSRYWIERRVDKHAMLQVVA